jgi:hypothetical protein
VTDLRTVLSFARKTTAALRSAQERAKQTRRRIRGRGFLAQ